ncbi:MAG: tRNA (5-methylaminomethyl-2-thiouridine)(34)-methyltransferase MnmD [Chitinophagales bacterium]|nr:tRNA (5-methylaminomethyl-2-thiouridine)(34)-methyltransferase MnmD [Chitinophagales bacterium]
MQIITTGDGSHTLFSEQFNEVYKSRHGAVVESIHVFIKQGLEYVLSQPKATSAAVHSSPLGEDARRADGVVLEIGFGTGLNALLTMLHAEKQNLQIEYTAIEPYPVDIDTIKALNYTQHLGYEYCYGPYHTTHLVRWNEMHQVTPHFAFKKIQDSVLNVQLPANAFNVIYFDAFAPTHQPEMWTAEVFKKMLDALMPGGILVTYCSKVVVQKAMKEAGFTIEKTPGPPGRREMLRAHKPAL